jgi:low affinity Fe/Cu permease
MNGSRRRERDLRWVFHRFAKRTADAIGSPIAFSVALLAVLVWAALGSHYGWSDTWQLVINTATTIVTFLVVFLIQNTQNRDAAAIHLKVDELIRSVRGARNRLVDLEALTDQELEELHQEFAQVAREAEKGAQRPVAGEETPLRRSTRSSR